MFWKKATALTVTLLLLGLAACGQTDPAEETPDPAPTTTTTPVEAPAESADLTAFRETLAAKQAPWAIAYLGDLADGQSLEELVEAAAEDHAFLADLSEEQVVATEGSEVYCLVPADLEDTCTVQSCAAGEDGDLVPGKTLYEGGGQPVLLVCNVSDVLPNLLVTVTGPDGTTETYAPCRSLCDGSVALPAASAAYDFSVYPDAPTGQTHTDFVGSWTATVPQNGAQVLCALTFADDGTMTYRVGYSASEWADSLEGTFYVIETSSQYPAGSILFELTSTLGGSDLWGVFSLTRTGSTLTVAPVSGDPLLAGYDTTAISFARA